MRINKANVIYRTKVGYDFEEVDIFLRVKGRLPNQKGDKLTREILNEYCQKFEDKKLTKGIISLRYLYDLIKNHKIKVDCGGVS